MGHSADCRGPYVRGQTSCYCGYAWEQHQIYVLGELEQTLIGWSTPDAKKDLENLQAAAKHHVAWKEFACKLLAAISDTEEYLWLDEKLPPVEILERPDAINEIAERLRNSK